MSAVEDILLADSSQEAFAKLNSYDQALFNWQYKWLELDAHKHQIEPAGDWWSIWLMLAGRGAGKTRAAAETLSRWAWDQPGTRWLVSAPTSGDLKGTCFEGDSGLIKVIPSQLVAKYNSSLHELHLKNGSFIKGIPASEPERFRGPQFHGGWCCAPGTMIELPDGLKPIESVQVGDMVMTRHGPRRVTAAGVSGNPNDLAAIVCGDTSLTVTIDHPILVGDQWIPAGDIKQGDMLCQVTSTSAAGTRTELSTNSTMGRYLRAGLSIIETKIKAITIQPILRRCQRAGIRASMLLGGHRQSYKKSPLLLRWNRCGFLSPQYVVSVARSLFHALRGMLEHSVPVNALRFGGATSSFQKRDRAMFVPLSTSQSSDSRGIAASPVTQSLPSGRIELRPMEVLSVERLPNSLTYSLTVEGEHEFIANSIVVHNCDELAAWEYLQESWDMIQFGIRLGSRTKLICSTTPKPKETILDLIAREGDDVVITRASTYSNINNLAPSFKKQILSYEGTNLGRQEIHAEIIDPEDSGIVKRDWFKLWPHDKPLPKFEYILQSYDCATSDKTINDPTACITFGVFKPLDGPMAAMLVDCWQDHLQYPDLRPKVVEEYKNVYGTDEGKPIGGKKVDLILIEDKSAGISLIQDLQRAYLPVQAYNPGRADKTQRLSIIAPIIKSGRVWVPESSNRRGYVRDWAEGCISQICAFPDTVHDDFCDAAAQGLRYLRDGGWLDIDPLPQYDDDDYLDETRKSRGNPYAQ